MTSLSHQPYKGTRDWYPEDMRIRNYIFDIWSKISRRYGYEQYDAPLLELLEVYTAKSGQELAGEQTYTFTDRGDRTVAIRPEMTPSVSRMIAARRQEMAYPSRLFSIAQFMRYERPQRGREREFWQLNVDIFGASGIDAEAEVIEMGAAYMKEFGAKPNMFTIKVNNRELINSMMSDYLELDAVQSQMMVRLFDRKNKISEEQFESQATEIFGRDASRGLSRIKRLAEASNLDSLPSELQSLESVSQLKVLFERLELSGVRNVEFDITLMRGFDYYTGTVFEFFDKHPENNRAMFGGGRYDGLVGLFGAEPVSAVGIAPGLSTMQLFLESHNLLPRLDSTTDVYIVVLSDSGSARKLAGELREEGLNVELGVEGRKVDRQIKTAIKKSIPFMIFVGEEEARTGIYNLKDVRSSEEQKASPERIVSIILGSRRDKDDIEDLI
ncbi:histidine--tRNA ligase [Candidatus Nomurabacteria bacterium]|nr:histidine--tRNA ligase [Candidatus Nomurabacteria bacterium]